MLCVYADCHYAACCYADCHIPSVDMPNNIILSVTMLSVYADCRYAECCYAESRNAAKNFDLPIFQSQRGRNSRRG